MKQGLTLNSEVVSILRRGGVDILPTDTLYGIVGAAFSRAAVRRIYRLRHRNPKKPMIILIGSVSDLKKFGFQSTPQIKKILRKIWPGKVSVVLSISSNRNFLTNFSYLHRGTNTLAFRLPANSALRSLLRKTGPLIAPSANLEGEPPARTIAAAKKYFGKTLGKTSVDFYVDAGRLASLPSTLIKIQNDNVIILRAGADKMAVLSL